MTNNLHCVRGCTTWDRHLPDCPTNNDHTCTGCQPRQVETGWLCTRCLNQLETLLDPTNPESITTVHTWLADNLGQHPRSPQPGNTTPGDGSTQGDHTAAVITAMTDLEHSMREFAQEFTEHRGMQLHHGTQPAHIAAKLRPWLITLADWEPIGDTITHLRSLVGQAHAVAPWRGKDPDAGERNAVLLWGKPAETTQEVCQRFGRTPEWLRKAKERGKIAPVNKDEKPLRWRPWDLFKLIHPEDAERYEARMARLGQYAADETLVWSSQREDGAV